MQRYFLKAIDSDEGRRYAICDKVSHTGYVYATGYRIAEAYDLDMAMKIVEVLNKDDKRTKDEQTRQKHYNARRREEQE